MGDGDEGAFAVAVVDVDVAVRCALCALCAVLSPISAPAAV
jgi:hypothetical protein